MAQKGPKQLEIEEEYGEDFWDVVRGYAEMGYSRAEVARILGYWPQGFHSLLRRHPGQDIKWPSYRDCMSTKDQIERRRPGGDLHTRACAWARTAREAKQHKRLTVNGESLTISEWARRSGVTQVAIRKRVERGWDLVAAVTHPLIPKGKYAHRRSSKSRKKSA